MAEVFRASREGVAGFARTCVIKRILANHNEDPSFVGMFINEAKIAAKLTHPNIVQVYELGQVDGEFFIAMEFVNGKDLLRVLRELAQKRTEDPAIPAPLAAYIARDTCRALQHAHDHTDERGQAQPIIHRDISPQNIMLSFDGMVKLVDFGIAKALGSMREETRTGALKGKFAYMAPEQISSKNPGPSADVFSTGVVLHEMLTGRRLFKGATDYETLTKVRSMAVPVPSTIDPRIPPELDAIVMKALARDRSARYERASQMARDLDGYLQSARISVEDMVEYMRDLFPPYEPGATTGDQTKQYLLDPAREASSRSRGGGSGGSRVEPTPVTGAGMLVRGTRGGGSRTDSTPTGGTGGRRTLFIAGGLALLVSTAGIFLVGSRGDSEPGMASERAPQRSGAQPREPEVMQLPIEMRTVRVLSEPTGARVYEGPRLLGETPIDLKLPVDSPGLTLTLVREGRADLTYLVRPADAPELTLRLLPFLGEPSRLGASGSQRPAASLTSSSGKARPATRAAARPTPSTSPTLQRPRVEIFEDGEPERGAAKTSPKAGSLWE